MATKTLKSRIKNKRDTSANWTKNDPVLLNGEIIIVDTEAGETRYKIGDGTKKYSQLPFQDETIRNLINNKLDKTATAADSEKLNGQSASYYATDSNVVHKTGDETVAGTKSFSSLLNAIKGLFVKTNGNAEINFETISTSTDYGHIYITGNSNTNRPLVLNASSNGSGPVGIGVVQPNEKLEVNGNVKATKFLGKIDWSNVENTPTIKSLEISLDTSQPTSQSSGDFWYEVTSSATATGGGWVSDYLPIENANMTGTPTAPTATKGTNTEQIATTAFVQEALSGISAKGFSAGTMAPTNTNLIWIDTGNSNLLKYYDGSKWTPINAAFG